jgi:hypothetical protein
MVGRGLLDGFADPVDRTGEPAVGRGDDEPGEGNGFTKYGWIEAGTLPG